MIQTKKILNTCFYIFFENSLLFDIFFILQAYISEIRIVYSDTHPFLPIYSYLLFFQNIMTILLSIFYIINGKKEQNKIRIIVGILAIVTTAIVWVPLLNFFHIPFGNY